MRSTPELKGRAARLARLLPVGAGHAARTPFVLLVVLLLGGGLIGLLVLNSALSEGSFHLDDLQKDTKTLTDEEQALQRDVDAYSAPDALQRRARELGMVPGGDPAFLNPDGTVKGVPGAAARNSSLLTVRPPEVIASPPAAGTTGGTTATPATPTPTPTPTRSLAAATPAAGTPAPRLSAPVAAPARPAAPAPAPTPSTQRSSTPGR